MLDIQRTGYCSAETAQKMAGRLSFAVTVSLGKVGRAFVRPFFAQANQPLPGGRASPWLLAACVWWTQYFERRPMASLPAGEDSRQRVLAWTDAAGASRKLSAVVCANGQWMYTFVYVPDAVWEQLLPRRDEQISMQEFLAIPLLLSTLHAVLANQLLLLAVDNQGVLGAMVSGRAGVDDLNMGVGKLWLMIADAGISVHIVRVESKANIADGPSRDYLDLLHELNAVFVDPVLPQWVRTLWQWPTA